MALAALDGPDLRDVAAAMSGEGTGYEPHEQRTEFYDRIYNEVYKELYPRPSALFPALENPPERS